MPVSGEGLCVIYCGHSENKWDLFCLQVGFKIEWVGAPHYLHVTGLKVEAREAGSLPETMQYVIRADENEYT